MYDKRIFLYHDVFNILKKWGDGFENIKDILD
jgi:hypothetical protein